jgi:hypothetical protein
MLDSELNAHADLFRDIHHGSVNSEKLLNCLYFDLAAHSN